MPYSPDADEFAGLPYIHELIDDDSQSYASGDRPPSNPLVGLSRTDGRLRAKDPPAQHAIGTTPSEGYQIYRCQNADEYHFARVFSEGECGVPIGIELEDDYFVLEEDPTYTGAEKAYIIRFGKYGGHGEAARIRIIPYFEARTDRPNGGESLARASTAARAWAVRSNAQNSTDQATGLADSLKPLAEQEYKRVNGLNGEDRYYKKDYNPIEVPRLWQTSRHRCNGMSWGTYHVQTR